METLHRLFPAATAFLALLLVLLPSLEASAWEDGRPSPLADPAPADVLAVRTGERAALGVVARLEREEAQAQATDEPDVAALRAARDEALRAARSVRVPSLSATLTDQFAGASAAPGGQVTFTATLENGAGAMDATGATFDVPFDPSLTITSSNASPLAFDALAAVDPGGMVTLTLSGSDADGDALSFSIVSGPSEGTLGAITPVSATTATVTYTNTNTAATTDQFTFKVNDGTVDANEDATVSINIDAAPTVTSTAPADNAADVDVTANITVTFSESVNLVMGAITIECPTGNAIAFNNTTGSGPASSFVLDPTSSLPANTTCTVTVTAASVTDNDTVDPPNNMAADFTFDFTTEPGAMADGYTATGNIGIEIDAAGGVLGNDDGGNSIVEVQGTACASFPCVRETDTAGLGGVKGKVSMNEDGSFTYEPPPGVTGTTDTFDYKASTASPSAAAKAPDATVTITLSDIVWFIDVGATSSASTGTFFNPFTSIAAFNAVNSGGASEPQTGQKIYLYEGTYTDGITLQDGQALYGDPVNLTTVFTANANSPASYSDGSDAAKPDAVNVSGDAAPVIALGPVALAKRGANDGITLAQNNTVRGLDIGDTPNGFGIVDNGTTVGTLTINDVEITGGGGAMSLTNGGDVSNVTFDVLESTSSAAENMVLFDIAGLITITSGGAGFAGSAAGSAAVRVDGTDTATNLAGFTYPGAITKGNAGATVAITNHGNTGDTITFSGAINATDGTGLQFTEARRFYTFSGAVTLNGGDAGIDILGQTGGTFNFNNTTITDPTGPALNIDGQAGFCTCFVNYTGGSITQSNNAPAVNINRQRPLGAIVDIDVSINATNGTGLQFDDADGTYTFDGAVTLNGGDASIDILGGSAGTFTFANTTITDPTGIAFRVDQSTASVNYNGGSITQNNTVHAVDVNAHSTGTLDFNVLITANTGAANGIDLTGVGTVNFDGGLDIDTSTGTGFNATGGGTINVTGNGNTITGTRKAVNIEDTIIGLDGVTFESISVDGSGASSVPAINLNDTGAGAFSVTGDDPTPQKGGDGSGGTIENLTDVDAVTLFNTDGLVSLQNMIIEDIGDSQDGTDPIRTRQLRDGIHGEQVDGGLRLLNMTMRRFSDNAVHGGTFAAGAVTSFVGLEIRDSVFEDSNRFTPSLPTVGDDDGEGMVRIQGLSGTVVVEGSDFLRGAELLDLLTATSGSIDVTIQGNDFRDAKKEFCHEEPPTCPTKNVGKLGVDVTIQGSTNATVRFGDPAEASTALGNTVHDGMTGSLRIMQETAATGTVNVIVSRNTVEVDDHLTGPDGSPSGSFKFNFPQGGVKIESGGGAFKAKLSHNTLTGLTNADGRKGSISLLSDGAGVSQFIVTENTFNQPWGAMADVLADDNNDMRVLYENNTWNGTATGGSTDDDLGGPCCPLPFEPFLVFVSGGNLDITIKDENLAAHDPSSGIDKSFYAEMGSSGGTLNLFLDANSSPLGYRLNHFASGGTFELFRDGSTSTTPQNIIDDNANTGGGGSAATTPPDVIAPSGAPFVSPTPIGFTDTAPALPTPPSISVNMSVRGEDANDAGAILPRIYFDPVEMANGDMGQARPYHKDNTQEARVDRTMGQNADGGVFREANSEMRRLLASAENDDASANELHGVVTRAALKTMHDRAKAFESRALMLPPCTGNTCTWPIGALPAGRSVTITVVTQLLDPLPAGQTQLATQGTLTADGPINLVTDDPDTGAADDPTLTPLDNPLKLVINEVDYDQGAADPQEFIELKNTGTGAVALGDYRLDLVDGDAGGAVVYQMIDLSTTNLSAGSYYVLCLDATPFLAGICSQDGGFGGGNTVQDGAPDAIALVHKATGFLSDVLSYEGDVPGFTETSGEPAPGDDPLVLNAGLSRTPDGTDTDDNSADFALRCDTPGATNEPSADVSACGTPLPVELTAFTAQRDGAAVVLTWQTASETNNAGFEVQQARLAEGQQEAGAPPAWQELAFVEGAGTTTEPKRYSYHVEDLAPGRYLFRLRQVDFDGAFTYSPEVEVEMEVPRELALMPNYPNPFNPATTIRFTVPETGEAVVRVYDALGREVALLYDGVAEAGKEHAVTFEAGTLATGLYVYVLEHGGRRLSRTLMLMK